MNVFLFVFLSVCVNVSVNVGYKVCLNVFMTVSEMTNESAHRMSAKFLKSLTFISVQFNTSTGCIFIDS